MKTRSRVIIALNKLHPEVKWNHVKEGFNWIYLGDNGWSAMWTSILTPRYDGDDETCQSQLWIYKNATNEYAERVFGV